MTSTSAASVIPRAENAARPTQGPSHPCRVVSVTYRQLRPFHGGDTGSIAHDSHSVKNTSIGLFASNGLFNLALS
jgi:hypothetical protein